MRKREEIITVGDMFTNERGCEFRVVAIGDCGLDTVTFAFGYPYRRWNEMQRSRKAVLEDMVVTGFDEPDYVVFKAERQLPRSIC